MSDPLLPMTWWRMLVDAVSGARIGKFQPAKDYIAFVTLHRGLERAEGARQEIRRLTKCESWADCGQWAGWGYKAKPPAVTYAARRK